MDAGGSLLDTPMSNSWYIVGEKAALTNRNKTLHLRILQLLFMDIRGSEVSEKVLNATLQAVKTDLTG